MHQSTMNRHIQNKWQKMFFLPFIFLLFMLSFISCKKTNNSVSFIALGTSCKISLPVYDSKLQKYVNFIYDEDDRLSYRKENSEIAFINKNAGKAETVVSENTYNLIKRAVNLCYETDGAFNPLLLPVIREWGFDNGEYRVPTDGEIEEALKLTHIEDLVLNDEKKSVFLKKEGMGLDLGGIAKGYVSDELYRMFIEDGIKSGTLNLGGNVFVFGDKDYKVAIQKPYGQRGEYDIVETVKNQAVITSGAYERYFEKDGKTYHHIIDPSTGFPSKIIYNSVTIISNDSTLSDALSTAIFIKGDELISKEKLLHSDIKVVTQ